MKTIDVEKIYKDAEKKRADLEVKLKCKVKLLVLSAGKETEPCVAFFKSASTFTKMQCLDLAGSSLSKAERVLFDATIVREESDKRIFIQDNDEDFFYLGALDWCGEQVTRATQVAKKK